MKILLTGATGFLGSHLIPAFLAAGHEVAILKRSFSDTRRIKAYLDKVKSFDIDLVPLERSFEECGQFDCVVHTATNYGRQEETATEVFEANLAFPLRLLQTATFFNTATILYQYLNYYALSKRQFEDWGRIFANQGKIQFVNIKLEHMYGPGDDPSKFTTRIVQSCVKNIDKIELTPGEQKRDFIYIDDVVDAYALLLKKVPDLKDKFQEFDLGSGRAVSIREFVETVHSLTGSTTMLLFGALPYRENEIMKSEADITKLLNLGWRPKYDLVTGLKKMIEGEREKGNNAPHYQNPLIPEMKETSQPERQGQPEKPSLTLAEKTVDEVLRHFGSALNDARQHYRAFVEKGIKQGRRPELQGGGLVRSAGGDASVLFSKDKENRELSDQRVLGSGGFVGVVLQESERLLEKKYKPKRPIEELIEVVAGRLSLKPKLICSGSRQQKYSEARSLVAWLAVEETGHPAAEVARFLGISRVGVKKAVGRGMQLKTHGLLDG